jgi:GWxTD domain-containing protein
MAVRRLRRTGVCIAAEPWQTRLSELASRLGIARPATLLQSSLAEVPVVIGHLRPVILMPIGLLTGLPCAQVGAILMHELAHIRRHDYLVNLLQTFAEGLLFYHPAVWWMSHIIRAERENCCDDMVVASSGDAHEYASALAALAQSRWAAHDAAMAASGGNLVKRIRRLLKQPEGPRAALTPFLAASLIVIVFGAGLLAWQSPPPAPIPVQELATSWNKWLTEDVAYIITDAERNAFKRLGTDEEREHFIEQFWQRRDPTPDTPRNEFKEEHYRRIAFANEHFSVPAGIPGWKTDRGRIYIMFGPPDEIDAHPSGVSYRRPAAQGGGETSAYPFEDWRYRWIEGIGKDILIDFVDTDKTGEYQMTADPNGKDRSGEQIVSAFASDGSARRMTVAIRPDRTLRISVPVNSEAAQFKESTRITTPSGLPVGTQDFQGKPAQPVYQFEWKALDPGTYTLTTVVTDSPSGKVHTYTVAVTVK